MLAFDASSIIHAWDNYPKNQFPPLWEWIESKISSGEFIIAKIAMEEVAKKSPDCARFMKSCNITQVKISDAILHESLRIKTRLGIVEEEYHPDGVSENDILIIATAKIRELELVSEESRQTRQPLENRRLKIPAVCKLPDVKVTCLNFIELIRRSEMVFE